jgi:hypothetical protein
VFFGSPGIELVPLVSLAGHAYLSSQRPRDTKYGIHESRHLNCCASFDQQPGFERQPFARMEEIGRSGTSTLRNRLPLHREEPDWEQLLNLQASPHLSEGRLQMVERDNALRLFSRFA